MTSTHFPTPPTADVRRLLDTELSLRSRLGYVALLLASAAMTAVIVSLSADRAHVADVYGGRLCRPDLHRVVVDSVSRVGTDETPPALRSGRPRRSAHGRDLHVGIRGRHAGGRLFERRTGSVCGFRHGTWAARCRSGGDGASATQRRAPHDATGSARARARNSGALTDGLADSRADQARGASTAMMRSATARRSGSTMSGFGASGYRTFPGLATKAAAHPTCIAPTTSHASAATIRSALASTPQLLRHVPIWFGSRLEATNSIVRKGALEGVPETSVARVAVRLTAAAELVRVTVRNPACFSRRSPSATSGCAGSERIPARIRARSSADKEAPRLAVTMSSAAPPIAPKSE